MARAILSCLGLGLATAAATGALTALTGYTSPELLAVGAAVGGVSGNLATDLCKAVHRPVAARWLEGCSGVDENHHIAQALRLAQLAGLGAVLARFDQVWASDQDESRRSKAQGFSVSLHHFIERETKSAASLGATSSALPDEEQRIRDAVLDSLPAVFDESLAARRDSGSQAALQDGLAMLRTAAERAVLMEVRLRTATFGRDLPQAFISAFEGSGFPDAWFDLFVRDAAFRLKDDTGFERIWNAEQLALVKAIGAAQGVVLAEVSEGIKRLEQGQARTEQNQAEQATTLQELLSLARREGAFRSAAEQGIPEAALRAIIERLGGTGISPEGLLPWLDNWTKAARDALERPTNEGAAFEAARQEAEKRFNAGRLSDASAAFMDEFTREERSEAARQAERTRYRVGVLQAAIRFDEVSLNIPALLSKLRLMAATEGIHNSHDTGRWLEQKAIDFYNRGCDQGSNPALVAATAVHRAALEERTRERVPLDWAMTQTNLGNALCSLGERETGTARLHEAVTAYRQALEEYTRERVPLQWKIAQSGLSNALALIRKRQAW